MMIKKVVYLSQLQAERLLPEPNTAMISITNPGETAFLQDGWPMVLKISFADASYDEATIHSYGRMWLLSSYGFPEKKHAETILKFLNNLPDQITTIIVHCGACVSRSAAVAKYIEEKNHLTANEENTRYNTTLFRLLHKPSVFDPVLTLYQQKPSLFKKLACYFMKESL